MEQKDWFVFVWAVYCLLYFGLLWWQERRRQNRERNQVLANALDVSNRFDAVRQEWHNHL